MLQLAMAGMTVVVCSPVWQRYRNTPDVRSSQSGSLLTTVQTQPGSATRQDEEITLGISPRGTVALQQQLRLWHFLIGRDYAIPMT